ncbi:MAG: TAT-variant-translocated molybdopterin oxidoreductase [Candidatus Hydrogenedentes bacterium]|nr:TAT-variant-translocated molybdopterin oxidoreductase [Candidatus Hydrogenedentota bacterium]
MTKKGPQYWRSLDELLGKQEIDALVHREFPAQVSDVLDPVGRRNFLKVMGASMMLAGLSSCARQPDEKIVPYIKPPEYAVPGKANYYATAVAENGYGMGVVATSFEGRPTKYEGLREHPASLGATNATTQAAILDMYDPDRLDTVLNEGDISTWKSFITAVAKGLNGIDTKGGAGLRILSGTVTSPTFGWQFQRLQALYPEARWHQFTPLNKDNVKAGAELAFGRIVDQVIDFTQAAVVLSLDSNFLHEGPAAVRYARDYALSRDFENNGGRMSRLYALESSPTGTGAQADHRVTVRYPGVETFARTVAARLGIAGCEAAAGAVTGVSDAWLNAVVEDLQANRGKAIVVAGPQQPAAVHALAHAINAQTGAVEAGTISYIEPVEVQPTLHGASLASLVADMNSGAVQILVILGGNPVYDTPADINFADAMTKVALCAHLTSARNETTRLCHWAVPQNHSLECWSDIRAYDGTTSLIQPLILPLYAGKSAHDVLNVLLGEDEIDDLNTVQAAWMAKRGAEGFPAFWKQALATGIITGTASPKATVQHKLQFPAHVPVEKPAGLDIVFLPDPTIGDGARANNAWLQELPKPLTNLTWDNAVHINPRTARTLHLQHEDEVIVEFGGKEVKAAVMMQFGHPQNAITVHLGYGRTHCGAVGAGLGFNAYALQQSASPWFGTNASLRKTGNTYVLARTEEHYNIEQSQIEQGRKAADRHLVREAALDHFKEHPDFAQHVAHEPSEDFTLYDPAEKKYDGYNWGMSIDLNKCTGCGVCVVACQSENNTAVVGKDQVLLGREMQWIRVDRYYRAGDDGTFDGDVAAVHQPVPCMQCENAPCEPVCPVGATMHSEEGLNDMVYNRCVGTRYCANNCPYKVRRFNFFKYSDHGAEQLKMMRNPNVTVRSRGVMEKCTYCVQRINIARIDAKREGRDVREGEIVTACQAACPSTAIVFGNIADPNSAVARQKASKRNYGLIADVGTRPRTTYLAKLNNPSPALQTAHSGAADNSHQSEH